jgi:hypothetical protein
MNWRMTRRTSSGDHEMPETQDKKPASTIILNAYYGTVNPASVETKKDKNGADYVVAKLDVHSPEKTVDLYVFGKAMETFRAKIEAGGQIFVQGESRAAGKGINVSSFEPKTYEAKISKIHETGTTEYGDWTAANIAIEGMDKEKNVMFSGNDARAASAAGEGGTITFQGAWKPKKNEQTGKWYSRLVSASSLKPNAPDLSKEMDDLAPGA